MINIKQTLQFEQQILILHSQESYYSVNMSLIYNSRSELDSDSSTFSSVLWQVTTQEETHGLRQIERLRDLNQADFWEHLDHIRRKNVDINLKFDHDFFFSCKAIDLYKFTTFNNFEIANKISFYILIVHDFRLNTSDYVSIFYFYITMN